MFHIKTKEKKMVAKKQKNCLLQYTIAIMSRSLLIFLFISPSFSQMLVPSVRESCNNGDFGSISKLYIDSICVVAVKEHHNWPDAQDYCQTLAKPVQNAIGRLITLESSQKWQWLLENFDDKADPIKDERFHGDWWIGAKKVEAPYQMSSFRWFSDETTAVCTIESITHKNGKNVDLESDEAHSCLRIEGDRAPLKWLDKLCTKKIRFFCEITEGESKCGTGFIEIGGICYKHYYVNLENFESSFQACRDLDSVLAAPANLCALTKLLNWIKKDNPPQETYWINMASTTGNTHPMMMDPNGCTIIESDQFRADVFEGNFPYVLEKSTGKLSMADAPEEHGFICMKSNCNSPDYCKNGGVCFLDLEGTKRCSCPKGFHGTNCELSGMKKVVSGVGFCQDKVATTSSTTTTTTTTTTVATTTTTLIPKAKGGMVSGKTNKKKKKKKKKKDPSNKCNSNPCQNGGTCLNKGYKYECFCTEGWNGIQCQYDYDECQSNPCKNKGTCNDQHRGYNCTCLPTFSGTFCEEKLTTCDLQEQAEMQRRIAMMAAWSLSSVNLLVMLGVIIGIFIILFDFSTERLLHLGQELSLLLGHLLVLFARTPTVLDTAAFCDEEASQSPPKVSDSACKLVAMTLHYLFLVHFLFLLLEAVHNYTTFTYVVTIKPMFNKFGIIFLGIVTPLIPVGLTAAFFFNTYIHEKTCWLNFDGPNFYCVVFPAVAVACTAIIVSEASGTEFPKNTDADHNKRVSAFANSRSACFIIPLSLTAWIFGMLGVDKVNLSYYSIASTLNIVLGVFMIISHTLGNKKARDLLKRMCCCTKSKHLSRRSTYEVFH